MAFVYLVRCVDQSLYVGCAENVEARIAMHNEGRGGRYTRRRSPVTLVFVEAHASVESATHRERQNKRWSSATKEALVSSDVASLKRLAISRHSPRFSS